METGENQGLDSGVSESGVSPGAGWVRRGGVGLAWRTRREAVRLHTVAASSSPRGGGCGEGKGACAGRREEVWFYFPNAGRCFPKTVVLNSSVTVKFLSVGRASTV